MEKETFKKVQEYIAESCGIEEEIIKPESSLFDELNIDSIDMVDILYSLETEYDIEIKVTDINKDAIKELGDTPFEIDSVLTPEGIEALKKHAPDLPAEKLVEGINTHQVAKLVTVKMLCGLVENRISEKESSNG